MFLRINEIQQKMRKVVVLAFLVHYSSTNPIEKRSPAIVLYKSFEIMPKKRKEKLNFNPYSEYCKYVCMYVCMYVCIRNGYALIMFTKIQVFKS